MTEPETSSVPAPFDSLPEEEVTEEPASPDEGNRFSFPKGLFPKGRLGLFALFVVFAGLGQGIAVTFLFGEDEPDLSDQVERQVSEAIKDVEARIESVEATVPTPGVDERTAEEISASGTPVVVKLPPAPVRAEDLDELTIARERFDHGDVEGARRIAGAWLLRMDGMAPGESARAPEAYGILADVLRRDFERTRDEGSAQ